MGELLWLCTTQLVPGYTVWGVTGGVALRCVLWQGGGPPWSLLQWRSSALELMCCGYGSA